MRISTVFAVLVLVAAVFIMRSSAQTPAPNGTVVAGEIIVKFRPGVNASAKADAHRQGGGTARTEIVRTGLQLVTVPRGTETAAISRYRNNPNVSYAQPNFVRRLPEPLSHAPGSEIVPGDYYFDEQWALHNTGQYFYCIPFLGDELCFYIAKADADIDAPEAWALSTGTNVAVAIIDTGLDYSHPDLAGKFIGGWDFVNNDGDPMDDHGHGTHVAGTIAALINNPTGDPAAEEGVAGVAPNALILSYKVCTPDGQCNDFAIAQAIARAVTDGAKVINMSLGGIEYSQAMFDAVQDAWTAGLVIVAGAGNDGVTTPFYPAAFPNVIAVGAFDEDHRRASFSNYGNWVDISAPGNVIMSTVPMSQCTATTTPGDIGCYTWNTGTSMATPHVSGAAALVWSRGDVVSNQQVVDILLNSADPRGIDPVRLDSWSVHGGLNLHNAMTFGSENQSPIADAGDDVTVADSDGNGGEDVRLDGRGSSDPDGTIASYEWIENGASIASGASPLIALANGTHTIVLQVMDNQGSTDTDSLIVTVNPLALNSPPVANAGADQAVMDSDGNDTESVTLNGSGSSDPDGSIVSYVWRDGATVVGMGATASVSLSVGSHTLTLQVTDNDGATAFDSVVVTVNQFVPPPPPSVHIGDLDGAATGNKSTWSATVTVAVHNGSNHGGVSGAMVTGTWTGAASETGSCTTGSGGTCQLSLNNLRKRDGSATFTVTGITVSGATYVSGQNHDVDGSSAGTTVVVAKP
jgi:thermitase